MDIEGIIKQYCEVKHWKDSQEISSIKLKKVPKKCPDCDRIEIDRRVNIHLNTTPKNHYKFHCNKCGMCKNPVTGKYDMLPIEIRKYYQAIIKEEANDIDK